MVQAVPPPGLTRPDSPTLIPPGPAGPRELTLDGGGGVRLSGLLAEPEAGQAPRAVVVALHGSGMRAGYFDNRARPGLSLLELGSRLGYTVLALDRPGYGASAAALPEGQDLAGQTATLGSALADFAGRWPSGAGFLLLAHSGGGRPALSLAAAGALPGPLIGLDLSGLGSAFAVEPDQLPGAGAPGAWRRHWGPVRLYPPEAFRQGQRLVAPVPATEAGETLAWPRMYPELAARVRVPVRFTFAAQEQWWRTDEEAVRALLAPLAAPRAVVDRLPDAGHNISLGWAARTYHLRVLAFLEECLLAHEAAPSARPPAG
ncbi:alpha/beta hydrolase [Streptomyces sp. NPDC006658]|uniref:alpha/beta hydrolase n=1 Tax=Streptomyces sp. NPDC006658 TaxID=3156900 RepID=UPI0033FAEFC6